MLHKKTATVSALLMALVFPSPTSFSGPSAATIPDNSRQEMLETVNLLRSKGCHCGRKYMPPVRPLSWNDRLEKAALAHAADMRRHDFFSHQSSNGKGIGDRADKAGYRWRAVGENIAFGTSSFKETMLAWKESPGHCRNLMSGGYAEMGVAQLGDLWVQDFGAPLPRP